jgi:hypothetical protein
MPSDANCNCCDYNFEFNFVQGVPTVWAVANFGHRIVGTGHEGKYRWILSVNDATNGIVPDWDYGELTAEDIAADDTIPFAWATAVRSNQTRYVAHISGRKDQSPLPGLPFSMLVYGDVSDGSVIWTLSLSADAALQGSLPHIPELKVQPAFLVNGVLDGLEIDYVDDGIYIKATWETAVGTGTDRTYQFAKLNSNGLAVDWWAWPFESSVTLNDIDDALTSPDVQATGDTYWGLYSAEYSLFSVASTAGVYTSMPYGFGLDSVDAYPPIARGVFTVTEYDPSILSEGSVSKLLVPPIVEAYYLCRFNPATGAIVTGLTNYDASVVGGSGSGLTDRKSVV